MNIMNKMNKKDRIAVVITALYFLIPLGNVLNGEPMAALMTFAPIIIYWGFRFIRNDISFIGENNDQS